MKVWLFSALWISLCMGPLPLLAGEANLTCTQAAPPESVAATLSEVLDATRHTVTVGEQIEAHFWLRRDVPLKEAGAAPLGVSFGQLEEGMLLGIVQFPRPWSDYKKLPIPAGTYTLRYGIQPADGNHMGVSFYRDYLLLIPAAQDSDPLAPLDHQKLVEASKQATGVVHPGVLALYPVYEEGTAPQVLKNEMDQWMLVIDLHGLRLGLVIEGHGEIEG